MAHIEKRRRNGSQTWRARYRTLDGRERSKTFTRKTDAESWLVQIQADLARGQYIDPRAGRVTVADYAEQWRQAQVHRESTAEATSARLNKHIIPVFGHRPLGSILPSEIQAWVKHLTTILAPSTVEACYRLLATILRSAVADRLIASSPCVRIRLPDKPSALVEPLTVEQVEAVGACLPQRARAIVMLAAGTGLRQGEALGLSLDRVDFLRRTLTVDRQLVRRPNGELRFGPPKTKASIRTIPVPDVVLESLSTHLARFPVTHDWGVVFTNGRGGPWDRTWFAELWRRATVEAGLPAGTRFHDLRHHTASLLIAAGCSVKVVQHQLGHASASETLDTYGHLWTTDNDRVRTAINEAFTQLDDPARRLGSVSPGTGHLVPAPPSPT